MTTYEDVERAVLIAVASNPNGRGYIDSKMWGEYDRLLKIAWRTYAMFLEERANPGMTISCYNEEILKAKALVARELK